MAVVPWQSRQPEARPRHRRCSGKPGRVQDSCRNSPLDSTRRRQTGRVISFRCTARGARPSGQADCSLPYLRFHIESPRDVVSDSASLKLGFVSADGGLRRLDRAHGSFGSCLLRAAGPDSDSRFPAPGSPLNRFRQATASLLTPLTGLKSGLRSCLYSTIHLYLYDRINLLSCGIIYLHAYAGEGARCPRQTRSSPPR